MKTQKSWKECLNKKREEKIVVLEKSFAGIKAGSTLYVGTPEVIKRYIEKIPYGKTASIIKMRNQLARRKKADAMCPTSSSIFIRMVAEAALEDIKEGAKLTEVTPFWRVIEPESKIAERLSIDPEWIQLQRDAEQGL